MEAKDILQRGPAILPQSRREAYFETGGIVVEEFVDAEWREKLQAAAAKLIDRSRALTQSNAVFDLEEGHSAVEPRLRRVSSPCDQDETFWRFLTESPLILLLQDLLGPDIKYYQSKLNFKCPKGGSEVKWHQDAPFFPHTNDAVLTVGIYLDGCDDNQGPLEIIPGSQKGLLYDHYGEDGVWTGSIAADEMADIDLESAVSFCGPAGSLTLHNYRTVHGSRPNNSPNARPLLLYVLSAADAMPYTPNALPSKHEGAIVAGRAARAAHHSNGHYPIPPDWSGGYSSIFAHQQRQS